MITNFPTNEQKIKDLIEDLTSVELAMLRERIVSVMELTLQSINDNPSKWQNGFIAPSLYFELNAKVEKHIGFTDSINLNK
jgi:hypothetical protein